MKVSPNRPRSNRRVAPRAQVDRRVAQVDQTTIEVFSSRGGNGRVSP